MKIEGCRVLVTGGNRGIGLALSQAFQARGADVWIGVRDIEARAENSKIRSVHLDLSSRATIERCLPSILDLKFDILVNNAGQLTGGLLEEQSLDEIYSMFQVNLIGLTHLTHAVLPGMLERQRGRIVNNASVSGVMNFPLASTYAASKAGVVALTACLAAELRGTELKTLTLLTPGVKTRMFDEIKTKYGAKMDLAAIEGSILPEVWAEKVMEAIEDDLEVLEPRGTTGLGLLLARYFPRLFNHFVATKFRRLGN